MFRNMMVRVTRDHGVHRNMKETSRICNKKSDISEVGGAQLKISFGLIHDFEKQIFSSFKVPPHLHFHYFTYCYNIISAIFLIIIIASLIETRKFYCYRVIFDQLFFIILDNLQATV